MTIFQPQTAQQFFERHDVENAKVNLSASALEPVSLGELLSFSPADEERFRNARIDYTPRHGSPALLEGIANLYNTLVAENVLVTSGVDDALGMLALALLKNDDRVVVLCPTYPPHVQLPLRFGAQVIPWSATEDNGWAPDLDELRKLVSIPTRMVITGFPQNPTGFMPDKAYASEMIEIVTKSGAVLISDEIYAGLPEGSDLSGSNLADQDDRVITLNGLSKTYGLPGLRVGWIASQNKSLMASVKSTRDLFNAYTPTPVEILAEIALKNKDKLHKRNASIVSAGAVAAANFFRKNSEFFEWNAPQAGVLSFPKWLGPGGARNLSERLIADVSIALAPGECFDAGDDNLRFSVGQRSVVDGLDQLQNYLETNY